MAGINLGRVRQQASALITLNDAVKIKYSGSYAKGIGSQEVKLLTRFHSGSEHLVLKDMKEETKRSLISFIKYFPLSEDSAQSDYVDFLAHYCPSVLYEYCLLNHNGKSNHPLLDPKYTFMDPQIEQHSIATITNRLTRLLDNQKFAKGLLTHLSKSALPDQPQLLFEFKNLSPAIKDSYREKNDVEKGKFLNKHVILGKITKSIIVTLFGFNRLYKLLYGSTHPKLAAYLGGLNSKPEQEKKEILTEASVASGSTFGQLQQGSLGSNTPPPASPVVDLVPAGQLPIVPTSNPPSTPPNRRRYLPNVNFTEEGALTPPHVGSKGVKPNATVAGPPGVLTPPRGNFERAVLNITAQFPIETASEPPTLTK